MIFELKNHQNFHQNFVKIFKNFRFFWPKTPFFARCRKIDFFLKKRNFQKMVEFVPDFCPSGRATRSKKLIFCHFWPFFRFPLQSKGIPHFPRKSDVQPPLDDFFMIFWVFELFELEDPKNHEKIILHENFKIFAFSFNFDLRFSLNKILLFLCFLLPFFKIQLKFKKLFFPRLR